jgi:dTDP-4-amino-4,6-dideoxygalactose transaminase
MTRVPFNRPFVTGAEFSYIQQVIDGSHQSGGGPFTARCHTLLAGTLGAPGVLLTTSGTHALEMAALLLDIQPGDEVILPSFTFVSTANAFVLRGATPVFVDIRPDTLNMDETRIERLIGPRTRAVVPVHYAGVGCEMRTIMEIAGRRGIAVVEDTAHGLFGRYEGRYLGTFGALSALSFHETKNFTCGEGGALVINDPALVQRAEIIREKGTDRSRFFRGQVDKYTWVDVGSSYLPSEMLAAYLLAQLEARDDIQARRRRIWHTYFDRLQHWAHNRGATLPSVPADVEQAYHMFYVLLPDEADRDACIRHLYDRGVNSVFHYVPLHRSAMGAQFPPRDRCPVTEDASGRLLRLPFFSGLEESEQARVIDALVAF